MQSLIAEKAGNDVDEKDGDGVSGTDAVFSVASYGRAGSSG